jgi:hypothetical protein
MTPHTCGGFLAFQRWYDRPNVNSVGLRPNNVCTFEIQMHMTRKQNATDKSQRYDVGEMSFVQGYDRGWGQRCMSHESLGH